MELSRAPTTPALALGTRTTVLAERAFTLLSGGPADPASVVREVCQIPAVQPALAGHLAVALLGGDSRFFRRVDGWWELAPPTHVIADRTLGGLSYVVVDVETTGVRALDGDRITEVAVVEVRNGTARVVFDSLINPERPIPPAITSLTGITWEMVRHAPRFADIAPQLAGVLEGHVFVAHNAAFDWRFVSTEMQRATGRPLDGMRLCTVKLARRLVPTLYRRSLDAVTEFFGIQIHARHRAGGDAIATAEVLIRLLNTAQDFGLQTIDDLHAHLRAPRRRRRRPLAMPGAVIHDSTA
ncbi:MAG: exonuclease domain-containing protein [Gemmatimonadaceae bacterium]